jgi:hypothetical protein
MITALAYLATSLTLGILLSLARRQHHEISDNSEVYRYPSLLVNVIALATPIYGVMAAFVYMRDPQGRSAGFIFSLTVVFGAFIIGNTLGYFYFRSFKIDVSPSQMVVSSWGRRKYISWEEVAIIGVVVGFRGGGEMTLFNRDRKLIFKIASSIEDFDDLVWAVKNNTRHHRVLIRERDRYGKWSESINQ